RRLRQAERVGERHEQVLLRLRFGELASERLARIGERMVDQFLLLAALRGRDLDLMPALDRERFAEQRAVLDLVRQEDATRRRLIVIELRQKRAEHFARFERAVRAREVGAVAPVLTGAEEEHLDARISALLVH